MYLKNLNKEKVKKAAIMMPETLTLKAFNSKLWGQISSHMKIIEVLNHLEKPGAAFTN